MASFCLSGFPHVSAFYRSALQYKNQISVLNGKKVGSDVNLYKLFVEQCFNLLRNGSCRCGIITPGGVYTDLGSKQLREMLLSQCKLDTLFGLSNERFIFENVHHAQKFCLLVFEKGGTGASFAAAFRINPRESVAPDKLERFLNSKTEHLQIPTELVRRLSPDSLSVMEFKNIMEIEIAEKMVHFPFMGSNSGSSGIRFAREFDMTQSGGSRLVTKEPKPGSSPLYEGKMIWQFDHSFSAPNFWVDPKALRKFLLGKHATDTTPISADSYRLVLRRQSASTNERTLITTIIPPGFHADNLASVLVFDSSGKRLIENAQQVFVCALLNSFVVDAAIRQRVTNNLNFFFLYQLPIPRLEESDPQFKKIVDRAARLICTTDDFDDLAKELGLSKDNTETLESSERVSLRAEVDALVAHLYGLSEEEFAYVLMTFPLVEQGVKDASLVAYKAFAPKSADQNVMSLIASGESVSLEFKSSARWDLKENKANKILEQVIMKTAAGFLNVESGGTLLIGVNDDGQILGLENDYKTMGKKPTRDGYENWLTTLLLGEFGKDSSPLIRITFHEIESKEVCQIVFGPSPRPLFIREGNAEHLYIRTGNSTRLLTSREAVEFCKQRWP